MGRAKVRHRGSALPLVLGLLTVFTAVAVSAARTSVANTRLLASIAAGEHAFRLATAATTATLQSVRNDPTLLPASGAVSMPEHRRNHGTAQVTLHHTASSANCSLLAPLASERIDYEIRVTARGQRGALSHQRQGFYICREICSAPCLGVETLPMPTHWYVTRPDKP